MACVAGRLYEDDMLPVTVRLGRRAGKTLVAEYAFTPVAAVAKVICILGFRTFRNSVVLFQEGRIVGAVGFMAVRAVYGLAALHVPEETDAPFSCGPFNRVIGLVIRVNEQFYVGRSRWPVGAVAVAFVTDFSVFFRDLFLSIE